MFRGSGTGDRALGTGGGLLLVALCVCAAGCGSVVDSVAGVFGPGTVGEDLDAHVVYRLRPDCPVLLARTLRHGYTVMTPGLAPEGIENRDAFVGTGFEETGVFEGPVRTGEVVFRYIPPADSGTRDSTPIDVVADVDAVRLDLEAGRDRLDALCGPLIEGSLPDPDIPRIPAQ
jgi:hypothetical protein